MTPQACGADCTISGVHVLALQLGLSCPSGTLGKQQDVLDQRMVSDARNVVSDGPEDDNNAGDADDASNESGHQLPARQARVHSRLLQEVLPDRTRLSRSCDLNCIRLSVAAAAVMSRASGLPCCCSSRGARACLRRLESMQEHSTGTPAEGDDADNTKPACSEGGSPATRLMEVELEFDTMLMVRRLRAGMTANTLPATVAYTNSPRQWHQLPAPDPASLPSAYRCCQLVHMLCCVMESTMVQCIGSTCDIEISSRRTNYHESSP